MTSEWVAESPPYDPKTGELWVMPWGILKAPDGMRWQADGPDHWVQVEHRVAGNRDERRLTTDEMLAWAQAAKGRDL